MYNSHKLLYASIYKKIVPPSCCPHVVWFHFLNQVSVLLYMLENDKKKDSRALATFTTFHTGRVPLRM